jgi:hypothetical protein
MLPKFYKCHRKEQSRYDTIIDAYKDIFKTDSIPSDRQYWTLCNYQADDMGNVPDASEIAQIVNSGLLSINQFYGVELLSEAIEHNKKYIPDAKWFNGSLYDTIVDNMDNFNPSIINIDLNCMMDKSIHIITRMLKLINILKTENIMIVLNVMVTNPRQKTTEELMELNNRFISKFPKNKNFLNVAKGWNVYKNKIYSYHGTGKQGKTIMSTLIFWKGGEINE